MRVKLQQYTILADQNNNAEYVQACYSKTRQQFPFELCVINSNERLEEVPRGLVNALFDQ